MERNHPLCFGYIEKNNKLGFLSKSGHENSFPLFHVKLYLRVFSLTLSDETISYYLHFLEKGFAILCQTKLLLDLVLPL